VVLALPALRERRCDILPLLVTFANAQGHAFALTADAAEALLNWSWPLNVRELQALVLACTVRGLLPGPLGLHQLREVAPAIAAAQLARRAEARADEAPARSVSGPVIYHQVRTLLEAHGGNVSAVADELGKPRAQVYRWLRAMGVSANRFRK
jgi:DNA-binding NtrC family response regulator